MVIKRLESRYRVDHEVAIPRNVANRVRKESDMQDRRHASQTLEVLPLLNVILMQVEELQVLKARENTSRWKTRQLVI